jgi:hypothetical protein
MFTLQLTIFDKICVALAIVLGMVLSILGLVGTVFGCTAHFTLDPLVGILPLFFGWGIVKAGLVAWRLSDERRAKTVGEG